MSETPSFRSVLRGYDPAQVDQWQAEHANALARLSREDAQRLEALPTRVDGGRVVVAVAEPTEQRLAALRELIGEETVMIVVPKSALDAGLRSDLLRSSTRGQFSQQDPDVESQDEPELPPAAVYDEPDPEPEPDPESDDEEEPVTLAEVTPLHIHRPEVDITITDTDAVAILADEAQAVAERLATQAAAVRAQQHELRERSEQFESRIIELEQHLEERTEQLNRLRAQLTDLLASFDD